MCFDIGKGLKLSVYELMSLLSVHDLTGKALIGQVDWILGGSPNRLGGSDTR